MICYRCNNTGKYLGNGMMQTDCTLCDDGIVSPASTVVPPTSAALDRRSKSYKTAIDDIMTLNPKISRADAVKMFDDAYDKS